MRTQHTEDDHNAVDIYTAVLGAVGILTLASRSAAARAAGVALGGATRWTAAVIRYLPPLSGERAIRLNFGIPAAFFAIPTSLDLPTIGDRHGIRPLPPPCHA
jgi:hypothetical protein